MTYSLNIQIPFLSIRKQLWYFRGLDSTNFTQLIQQLVEWSKQPVKQRDFSQRGRSKFSSKIFADKMMEYIFAVAVALHIAVAMTPEDSEKGVGRSAREFILPETDGDREAAGVQFTWPKNRLRSWESAWD